MRDHNFGLGWLFRITAICGSLLAAGRYSGFLFMFAVTSLALVAGCLWYMAMRRAPGPTLHLTIALLLLTPLFALIAARLPNARELERKNRAIHALKGVGLELSVMSEHYPELRRADNEVLRSHLEELLRQRLPLRFRGERERR